MEGMRGSEEEGTGVDKSAEDMQQIVLKALRINPINANLTFSMQVVLVPNASRPPHLLFPHCTQSYQPLPHLPQGMGTSGMTNAPLPDPASRIAIRGAKRTIIMIHSKCAIKDRLT